MSKYDYQVTDFPSSEAAKAERRAKRKKAKREKGTRPRSLKDCVECKDYSSCEDYEPRKNDFLCSEHGLFFPLDFRPNCHRHKNYDATKALLP